MACLALTILKSLPDCLTKAALGNCHLITVHGFRHMQLRVYFLHSLLPLFLLALTTFVGLSRCLKRILQMRAVKKCLLEGRLHPVLVS